MIRQNMPLNECTADSSFFSAPCCLFSLRLSATSMRLIHRKTTTRCSSLKKTACATAWLTLQVQGGRSKRVAAVGVSSAQAQAAVEASVPKGRAWSFKSGTICAETLTHGARGQAMRSVARGAESGLQLRSAHLASLLPAELPPFSQCFTNRSHH